ncbi:MAG: nuclear transport factor 2 family protein [Bacteroidota bacterium]
MKKCLILLPFALMYACEPTSPLTSHHLEAVLALHHAQRDHHFQKDSAAFVDQLSDAFISVNRGKITRPSRADMLTRYHGYFSAVEFVKWDDIQEPVIRFSEDSSLAYTIVDKMVRLHYPAEDGTTIEDETHFAWTTIYRREADKWKVESISSTNEESKSHKLDADALPSK